MSELVQLKELTDGWEARTIQEALDEVEREAGVRVRCFPRWIAEGRVSKSDARDRLSRVWKAASLLKGLVDLVPDPEHPVSSPPNTEDETPF